MGHSGFVALNLLFLLGRQAPAACVASPEVFDQTTGWTTVVLPIPLTRLDSNQVANRL